MVISNLLNRWRQFRSNSSFVAWNKIEVGESDNVNYYALININLTWKNIIGLLILIAGIWLAPAFMGRAEQTSNINSSIEFGTHGYSLNEVVDTLVSLGLVDCTRELGIVSFIGADSHTDNQRHVFFEERGYTTREAIAHALKGLNLEYDLKNGMLTFYNGEHYRRMEGKVSDTYCRPMTNVLVMLNKEDESYDVSSTDSHGMFTIFTQASNQQLFLKWENGIDSVDIVLYKNANWVSVSIDTTRINEGYIVSKISDKPYGCE